MWRALVIVMACDRAAVQPPDATAPIDATVDAMPDASPDAAMACAAFGAPGRCMPTAACTTDHTPYPGYCPGTPADIQCCIVTPNVANNPPVPAGYHGMPQADVTAAMTDWAVAILHDVVTYPMFSTTTMVFPTQPDPVLARVEWHPPDFQNAVVHRGVTLYELN